MFRLASACRVRPCAATALFVVVVAVFVGGACSARFDFSEVGEAYIPDTIRGVDVRRGGDFALALARGMQEFADVETGAVAEWSVQPSDAPVPDVSILVFAGRDLDMAALEARLQEGAENVRKRTTTAFGRKVSLADGTFDGHPRLAATSRPRDGLVVVVVSTQVSEDVVSEAMVMSLAAGIR